MVDEDDGSAEVCLELSVPLSTNLEVVVTSAAGTGALFKSLTWSMSTLPSPPLQLTVAVTS